MRERHRGQHAPALLAQPFGMPAELNVLFHPQDKFIPIAAHDHIAMLPYEIDSLCRIRALPDDIAKTVDPVGALALHILQHRFQCLQIPMYI